MSNLVEPESLYKKTLGVTSDIVLKEMYQVVSASGSDERTTGAKGSGGGLVLRPEGTAGVLRAILQDGKLRDSMRREPVKAWYWGPMFRHERP